MKSNFLGKREDYEYLGDLIETDSLLHVQVYLNKRKKRFEKWFIDEEGEIFVRVRRDIYLGVLETKSGWIIDHHSMIKLDLD
jgi:hypothetical protein